MTASAGAWYRVGTVNVTSGQQAIVGVGTNWQNDVTAIAIGDIFTVDSKTWYEVTAVNSDTSITLDRNFEGANAAGANYAIVRNTSGTILTRIAGQISVQFNQKQLFLDELRTWLNSDNAAEELTDSHGVKQELKTPAQMVRDHDDKLAELDAIHPFPWAMRKVEFEARRAANNEKFAASGFVHKGQSYTGGVSSYNVVAEGLWINTTQQNRLRLGRGEDQSQTGGASKKGFAFTNIAGVITKLEGIYTSTAVGIEIRLPPAEDGTRTYDSATGVSVTHATPAIAFASETETNKVVTDRVDMWGFEAFLREINDADPFVYKKGLPQSLATDINGVPTVTDNVRPNTYFAWYEGDTISTGKGVNWQTATETQRIAIASDPENNIYFDDATGKFYQWCLRGRSFAGAGNGDWSDIFSMGGVGGYLKWSSKSLLLPKGKLSSNPSYTTSAAMYLAHNQTTLPNLKMGDPALFKVRDFTHEGINYPEDICENGECYFLVCGTVNRLNQGAYHPSFNPLGSARLNSITASEAGRYWYQSEAITPTSQSDVFNPVDSSVDTTSKGYATGSGSLSLEYSGRPDGRYFDAIYTNGQGGVCRDMRYSAWGLTQEDFAEADLVIKSGNYRGNEKVPFSVPLVVGVNSITTYLSLGEIKPDWWNDEILGSGPIINLGSSKIYLFHPTTGEKLYVWSSGYTTSGNIGWYFRVVKTEFKSVTTTEDNHGLIGGEVLILQTTSDRSISKLYIADEYIHDDVIGNPENILLCDDLKSGWFGNWIPELPDGVRDTFKLNRPYSGSGTDILRTYTVDNGNTWVSAAIVLSSTPTNSTEFTNMPANQVTIFQYKTNAKVTKNAANVRVYGDSVGSVWATSFYAPTWGRDFAYSVIGKFLNNASGAGNINRNYKINSYGFRPVTGVLDFTTEREPRHQTLDLVGAIDQVAFKALNYNVVENQQGFINYACTELSHNGTDWGDDGKVHIVDGKTTMLDENGNTVFVGTARCVEPLGWIKNDK